MGICSPSVHHAPVMVRQEAYPDAACGQMSNGGPVEPSRATPGVLDLHATEWPLQGKDLRMIGAG